MFLSGSQYAESAASITSKLDKYNSANKEHLKALIRGRAGVFVWRTSLGEYAYKRRHARDQISQLRNSLYERVALINKNQDEADQVIEVTVVGWRPTKSREERKEFMEAVFESDEHPKAHLFNAQVHFVYGVPNPSASSLRFSSHFGGGALVANLPVLLVDILDRMSKLPQEDVLRSRDWEVLELIYTMSRSVAEYGDSNVAVIDLVNSKGRTSREISKAVSLADFHKIAEWIHTCFIELEKLYWAHWDQRKHFKESKSSFGISRKSMQVQDPGEFEYRPQLDSLNYFSQFFLRSSPDNEEHTQDENEDHFPEFPATSHQAIARTYRPPTPHLIV